VGEDGELVNVAGGRGNALEDVASGGVVQGWGGRGGGCWIERVGGGGMGGPRRACEEGCGEGFGRVSLGEDAVVHRAAVARGPIGEGEGGVVGGVAGGTEDRALPCVFVEGSISVVVMGERVRADSRKGAGDNDVMEVGEEGKAGGNEVVVCGRGGDVGVKRVDLSRGGRGRLLCGPG